MQKTTYYQLSQWAPEDQVKRTDFNADNAKLDAALAGKAEAADLTALQTQVNSDVTALQTAVNGKGTCTMRTGTYTGTGAKTAYLYLGSMMPKLLIVLGSNCHALFAAGSSGSAFISDGVFRGLSVTWSGTSVSWCCSTDSGSNMSYYALNASDSTYYYFAFC